jgi:Protein of unknown function (DUF1588)/Protein of unknown function (DUF1592)/Protein of unknown function (DUF1595)/Protein of unknown function (DUF1585)
MKVARMSSGMRRRLAFGAAVIGVVALAGYAAVSVLSGPGRFASEPSVPPQPLALRLISESQYIDTISNIFGADIAPKVRFAPVKRVDGLVGVGASSAILTSGGLDPLESTARSVAAQVVDPAHRPFLVPCEPENPKAADARCASAFFRKVGRLLYRRPLSDDELAKIVDAAGRAVGPAGDFYDGLSYALSGMLVSPEFLFIRENAEPDPSRSGAWRLDGYSKASRLSFLLWNAAPDDALLTAAEKGELGTQGGLRRQIDRMIASPLYQDGVRAFFTDFFVLENFDTLAKDPVIYPAFTLKAVEEAREQILRTVVDHLVTQHKDYRDLFMTRRTFLSSDLAVLYRVPVDLGSQGWMPYEFSSDDPRAGLLTQVGFLAQYAHPGRNSATRRGRAIREVLLCQKVPDPPPNVDFSKFEDPKNPLPTTRERLKVHREDPVCAGCHALTDPIGLGLDNFDGAGQYRAAENGARIDPSGTLDGMAFKDAVDLGNAVRNNPSLKSCIVERLYAYSVGRKVTTGELPLLNYYESILDKRGYRFDEMLRRIVLDKSFFTVKPPPVTVASFAKAAKEHANASQN